MVVKLRDNKSPVFVVYIEDLNYPLGFKPLETAKDSRPLMKLLNTHPERKKKKLILDYVDDIDKPTKLHEFEQHYVKNLKVVKFVRDTLRETDPTLSNIFSNGVKKIEAILSNIRTEMEQTSGQSRK